MCRQKFFLLCLWLCCASLNTFPGELIKSPPTAPLDMRVTFVVENKQPDKYKSGSAEYEWWRLIEVDLEIKNKTNSAVYLDWDRSALVIGTRTYRVIHKGVRLIDRDKPQAATPVAPYSVLLDFIWPSELFYWREGSRYSPGSWERKWLYVSRNEIIQILLCWTTDGAVNTGVWEFRFVPEEAKYLSEKAGDFGWLWYVVFFLLILGYFVYVLNQ